MQARIIEIEEEEEELRRQVQLLWAAFREAESTLTQETKSQSLGKRLTDTDSAVTRSVHASQGSKRVSPVAISDFVPVSTVRLPSPNRDLLPSALSTSLAASSFHHPNTSAGERRSTSPVAATLSSPLPTSPTLVGSINYRDPVRRDMNENKDIATSFKYVVDLEAERNARARQYQSLSNVKPPRVIAKLAGHSNPAGATQHSDPMAGPSTPNNKAHSEELLSPSGLKGKRKVTFDIKPVVPDGGAKEAQVDEQRGEASVFDLEDDNSDTSQRATSFDGLTLTLRDPFDSPSRPPRQPRANGGTTLPHPLQTLRPASLPVTVALRASDVLRPESPARKDIVTPATDEDDVASDDEALSPRDKELARLVNVTTPSHRNAWKRGRQSWKVFGSDTARDGSPESLDNETDAIDVSHGIEPNGKHALFNSGVSASLPISIASRDHTEDGPVGESGVKPEPTLTSTSYRKASYAARDRSRSLDPGALDFETGDDESLDIDEGDSGSLSRGRHHALKILQARSELPAEGMWRSLAT
ncbi:hypothetical protein F5148DRAFT_525227 [Russula earlei]|uniref:Uncharacterized protein n=1 Tax=Russula earlei TaxID=71964 RepID=A0ACC0TXX8_9AGAM|nr:hypothetical protein F5148DRAFT_525227 [Russula earlei]